MDLKKKLSFSNEFDLDPRDAAVYFSEWWKRSYDGGAPSKDAIFESIGGNILYNLDSKKFFNIAKKGAEMLGVKWLKKQNVLYFRTLLLQGGLPLYHISKHSSDYKKFLLAVLETQPEKIEDFIFQKDIINILPQSSRNDIIYENCFKIVRSILNDENTYDNLLSSNDVLGSISQELKNKKEELKRRTRKAKLQNYWLFDSEKNCINLRIGFGDIYTNEGLSQILGFEAINKSYQFYLNDKLICVFRRTLNGNYKTDWEGNDRQEWNLDLGFPSAYTIDEGRKVEVKDFVQVMPDLEKPTIWADFSDNIWRLSKSAQVSSDKAIIIFPTGWRIENTEVINEIQKKLYNYDVSIFEFEGNITLKNNDNVKELKFLTNSSFIDWTIISEKPKWMLKSNKVIIRNNLKILVYDEENNLLDDEKYDVYIKHHHGQYWERLSNKTILPKGYIKIKIIKDDFEVFDSCYNIGSFDLAFSNQKINTASITISNNDSFEMVLIESELIDISVNGSEFSVNVKNVNCLPNGIRARLEINGSRKLFFELKSPFTGVALIDNDGQIIEQERMLSFSDLYGIRILTPKNSEAKLKLTNGLRANDGDDVVFIKDIIDEKQPLISFKDELKTLYYLSDSMNYENHVKIELSCEGESKKRYKLSRFKYFLNVSNQEMRNVFVENSFEEMDLYAIPLNCKSSDINLISLAYNDGNYIIPNVDFTNQFIIISSGKNIGQLMPRFVNTDFNYTKTDKESRIINYSKELLSSELGAEPWKILLKYFEICINHDLPFSTFDQIISIAQSSELLSIAFFYLGINQYDIDEYVQKIVVEIEKDLGVCFHWVKKDDWKSAIDTTANLIGIQYYNQILEILIKYLDENDLKNLFDFFNDKSLSASIISNADLMNLRQRLGESVLNEIPKSLPKITNTYNIPIKNHRSIFLLFNSAIAAAESIIGINDKFPIFGRERDNIRRNIQYTRDLTPQFYKRILIYVLSEN
ncbi:hypothetical protein EDM00_01765 [Ornithobacterium rhinotracheale]|nr:hypothetical protein [Ornithobacterium rhinotracheale]